MPPKSNNYDIVYVLTNPAMPDMVKIGMTNRDTDGCYCLIANSSVASELEREIDRLVYGLYGLTEEEMRIVEE